MSNPTPARPEYGNWVSARILYTLGALALFFAALSVLLLWLLPFAVFFCLCFAYFVYARYKFAPQGGNVQSEIRGLVVDHLEWNGQGRCIDIGCGSGALAVMVAKKYPRAQIIGIDSWGTAWEYSQGVCEKNAEMEGVGMRISFRRASASSLPFDDESIDAAISNLTFHEVRDVRDKKVAIKEALRVVKKGGSFVF